MGRITAYIRIYGEDCVKKSSSSFLIWLSNQCSKKDRKHNEKSQKNKERKERNNGEILLDGIQTILTTLHDVTQDENDYLDDDISFDNRDIFDLCIKSNDFAQDKHLLSNINLSENFDTNDLLSLSTKNDQVSYVDSKMEKLYFEMNAEKSNALVMALLTIENPTLSQMRLIMKWVPLLTQSNGNSTIWKLLFKNSHLMFRCMEVWSVEYLQSCQKWILSDVNKNNYGCQIHFLIVTSNQLSIYQDIHTYERNGIWMESQIQSILSLALDCAEKKGNHIKSSHPSFITRNGLPDWLILIMMIARRNDGACDLVVRKILEEVSDGSRSKPNELLSILLHLYIKYPTSINLRDSILRSALLNATLLCDWKYWKSPMDNQLYEMLRSLSIHPNQRCHQYLCDLSRKHPLLVARQQSTFVSILENDGNMKCSNTKYAKAQLDQKQIKVFVHHWGMTYTEFIWETILDVLLSLHKEVIFHSCGIQMGLLDLLNMYIKLFVIQTNLQHTIRFRSKLMRSLSTLKVSNPSIWETWQTTRIKSVESWGTIQEIVTKFDLNQYDID